MFMISWPLNEQSDYESNLQAVFLFTLCTEGKSYVLQSMSCIVQQVDLVWKSDAPYLIMQYIFRGFNKLKTHHVKEIKPENIF